jgi:hypothetical protein
MSLYVNLQGEAEAASGNSVPVGHSSDDKSIAARSNLAVWLLKLCQLGIMALLLSSLHDLPEFVGKLF